MLNFDGNMDGLEGSEVVGRKCIAVSYCVARDGVLFGAGLLRVRHFALSRS